MHNTCMWFTSNYGFIFGVLSPINYIFIMQGSESFASWQANLLFEPVQFEVIVSIASQVSFFKCNSTC